jgi:aspartokinase
VAGIASETGLVLVEAAPRAGTTRDLTELLTRLDGRGASGKQLQFENREGAGFASVVLSLENLHDFAPLRDELTRAGFHLREGASAVSAIGTGINASFRNVRTTLSALAELGAPVLGLSTSSFRISVLLEERFEKDAVRRLHETLVEADPVL